MLTAPKLQSETPMSRKTVEAIEAQINQKVGELVALLLEIKQGQGYLALGFTSWTAYLSSRRLSYSRKQLYEFIRAQPVTERLEQAGIKANTSEANVLAAFPEEIQVMTARATLSRFGSMTESRLRRVATVFNQAMKTGHVEGVEGMTNAIEAALNLEDREAAARQAAYKTPSPLIDQADMAVSPKGDIRIIGLPPGATVKVSVWT